MNFFIQRKNISVSRYLNSWVFVKSTDCKICDIILGIAYFFWVLSSIKMKFGQVLVCCMKNICNMFLAQCWRLETSSAPFMSLLKWQYSEIWPFLIVDIYHFWMSLIYHFKKTKHWNLDIIVYWVIGAGC